MADMFFLEFLVMIILPTSAYNAAQCPQYHVEIGENVYTEDGIVGSCELEPCNTSVMGPTECISGSCYCKSGYCAWPQTHGVPIIQGVKPPRTCLSPAGSHVCPGNWHQDCVDAGKHITICMEKRCFCSWDHHWDVEFDHCVT
eukprot:gnl/MRDRNA2_/MRDRNA2_14950_c0_seq2.p2 gnl/MRDRNA2_/MRDRNA2_14950_c0~~gnl/MRDRNA2_/MRDRNA2_14950_c0_seq2.p2  ORF type:complete len:143 (+),score=9.65 gnl/MRDRNA2_/MRDRNA2_14950_c0_seq2:80-508(+)